MFHVVMAATLTGLLSTHTLGLKGPDLLGEQTTRSRHCRGWWCSGEQAENKSVVKCKSRHKNNLRECMHVYVHTYVTSRLQCMLRVHAVYSNVLEKLCVDK